MTQKATRSGFPRRGWPVLVLGVGALVAGTTLAEMPARPDQPAALPPLQVLPSGPAQPGLSPLYRHYRIPERSCNRSAIGAVAGGLIGGVIGERISEGKEGGVIAGSLVGALIGNLIGRGIDEASANCARPPAPRARPVPRMSPGEPTIQI